MSISSFFLRLSFLVLALSVGFLVTVPVAQAQTPTPAAAVITAQGPHFISGETVVLTEDLSGDVYVFGQNVRIENTITGDLIVAAAQVTITGTVTQDVRAAGANVDVRGTVGGNVTVAAGTFTIDRQGQVAGSVVSVAGTSEIYGQVGGNAWLKGSVMTIGGTLAQNLNVQGEKVTIQDGSRIAGNLTSLTSEPAVIAPSAEVVGTQDVKQFSPEVKPVQAAETFAKAAAIWFGVLLLMSLVAGSVLLALFPSLARSSSQVVLTQPLASFGWGLSHLILTPIVALLLMISVVGLPLGVIVLLLYFLSLIVGGWVAAYALGQKIYAPSRSTYISQLGQFGLGVVILKLLDLIPILGWLVKLVAMTLGMGALVIMAKNSLRGQTIAPVVIQSEAPKPSSKPVVKLAAKAVKTNKTRRLVKAKVAPKRRGRPRKK